MIIRHWLGRDYYRWEIPDSDLFVEIEPDGLIEIGDQAGDRNLITPEELKDLYHVISEVIQFIQDKR